MPSSFITHTDSPLEIIAASHMNDVQTAINGLEAGWTAAPETWTYASAATFTITGDYSAIYTVGTRIKLTNVTVKYFVVVSSVFAAGDTTVTVTGGSDYALASAAITSTYYSYYPCPPGYPDWFLYTPTGVSATNVTLTGRFRVLGQHSARLTSLCISPEPSPLPQIQHFPSRRLQTFWLLILPQPTLQWRVRRSIWTAALLPMRTVWSQCRHQEPRHYSRTMPVQPCRPPARSHGLPAIAIPAFSSTRYRSYHDTDG